MPIRCFACRYVIGPDFHLFKMQISCCKDNGIQGIQLHTEIIFRHILLNVRRL
jgi:DNA-directed RNA polymerase subunit N (RpoN/RPB10)